MKTLVVYPGRVISNTIIIPNNIIFGASDDGLIAYSDNDGEKWNILLDDKRYTLDSKLMKYIGNGIYAISGIYRVCANEHPRDDVYVIFATQDGTEFKEILL